MSFYKRINHVFIAVNSIEETAKLYTDVYGMESSVIISSLRRGVRTQKILTGNAYIELAQPLDPNGPVAAFIKERGEGLYLICVQVASLPEAVKALQAKGAKVIGAEQAASHDSRGGIFIHPKSAHGALIQLME
jgi:methylmalonyl-CoA epimerase